MPEENQTNLLGFYAAMNNFAGFLGASLGRQFITMTDGLELRVGSTVMGNKQLVLLLTAVFMLQVCWLYTILPVNQLHQKRQRRQSEYYCLSVVSIFLKFISVL